MISLARIINAFRDAEAFERPVEERSKLWHLLIYPQYAFSIFSAVVYFIAICFYFLPEPDLSLSMGWTLFIVLIDVLFFSWPAFEFSLKFFRKKFKNNQEWLKPR